ncbi:MAG TPA: ABC transporter ATP-binding protein, partial [Pseudomonadaceae bacterium]|nr:ABC transporter ATP-binding protein [Pseudomonadaceae bacterium]
MSLLQVNDLKVHFHTRNGLVRAVDGISFELEAGKTLAIIGESGSGKSVACYSLLGLVPMPPGRIEGGRALFEGEDLLRLNERRLRRVRGKGISIIFQDPMTSLNPYMRIGDQLMEPLTLHFGMSRKEAWVKAVETLEEVGIVNAEQRMRAWPFEFSGGMRQRVVIAMALITEPRIIIADEPTTALDVTVQAQILALLKALQVKHNIGVIFISHDLSVVADIADHICVMQNGRFVEQGNPQQVLKAPEHSYTRQLLAAVPVGEKPGAATGARDALVEVQDLVMSFPGARQTAPIVAVDQASLTIGRREIVGLVGESGSGKSTLGRCLLRLLTPVSGSVRFDGTELSSLGRQELKTLRRRMQMIFQDPYASLNPRMTVYDMLAEPLLLHKVVGRKELDKEVFKVMDAVGLA